MSYFPCFHSMYSSVCDVMLRTYCIMVCVDYVLICSVDDEDILYNGFVYYVLICSVYDAPDFVTVFHRRCL